MQINPRQLYNGRLARQKSDRTDTILTQTSYTIKRFKSVMPSAVYQRNDTDAVAQQVSSEGVLFNDQTMTKHFNRSSYQHLRMSISVYSYLLSRMLAPAVRDNSYCSLLDGTPSGVKQRSKASAVPTIRVSSYLSTSFSKHAERVSL